jgi:hypothetical protein
MQAPEENLVQWVFVSLCTLSAKFLTLLWYLPFELHLQAVGYAAKV